MNIVKINARAFIVGKEDVVFEKEVSTSSTHASLHALIIDAMDWLKSGENYVAWDISRIEQDSTPNRRAVTIARDSNVMTAATMIVDFEFTFIEPEDLLDDAFANWLNFY